jgi:hypothetical protein
MIEKIPFLYKGCSYSIIIDDDMSFDKLRFIIDRLNDEGAFQTESDEVVRYSIECEDACYAVGVDGTNVMIILK